MFISNLNIIPVISQSDIVNINGLTRILKIIDQCYVKYIMTLLDKNNNIGFESIGLHFHK